MKSVLQSVKLDSKLVITNAEVNSTAWRLAIVILQNVAIHAHVTLIALTVAKIVTTQFAIAMELLTKILILVFQKIVYHWESFIENWTFNAKIAQQIIYCIVFCETVKANALLNVIMTLIVRMNVSAISRQIIWIVHANKIALWDVRVRFMTVIFQRKKLYWSWILTKEMSLCLSIRVVT